LLSWNKTPIEKLRLLPLLFWRTVRLWPKADCQMNHFPGI
jgi:hypothetical protein